jgi:hypothetical protein
VVLKLYNDTITKLGAFKCIENLGENWAEWCKMMIVKAEEIWSACKLLLITRLTLLVGAIMKQRVWPTCMTVLNDFNSKSKNSQIYFVYLYVTWRKNCFNMVSLFACLAKCVITLHVEWSVELWVSCFAAATCYPQGCQLNVYLSCWSLLSA